MYVYIAAESNLYQRSICENCGKEYTAKDPSKHSGKVVWVQTESDHRQIYQTSAGSSQCWRYCGCEGDECGSEEEEDSADDERNLRLSSLGLIKMREEVSLLHRTPARSTSSL